MRTRCAVTVAFIMALLLTGCSPGSVYGVSNGISFAYPSMGFAGPYRKQLTLDDVRQIVRLAESRRDIMKPVDQIVMDRPDEAEVHTGNPQQTGDPACRFHARKRNGQWFISDKPYCTRETIITS